MQSTRLYIDWNVFSIITVVYYFLLIYFEFFNVSGAYYQYCNTTGFQQMTLFTPRESRFWSSCLHLLPVPAPPKQEDICLPIPP